MVNMKRVKLYEAFVNEGKAGSDVKSGEYIKSEYGYFYQRVDGMVGGQPAFVYVEADKKGKLKIGAKKTSIHSSVGYEKVTLEEIKASLGINEAKLSKVEILIDVLANLEDAFTEEEFVEFGTEDVGLTADTMMNIWNTYWDIDARLRLRWNSNDWANWLKKEHGVK